MVAGSLARVARFPSFIMPKYKFKCTCLNLSTDLVQEEHQVGCPMVTKLLLDRAKRDLNRKPQSLGQVIPEWQRMDYFRDNRAAHSHTTVRQAMWASGGLHRAIPRTRKDGSVIS